MISNFFEILLLSLIQGVSEFLPISSAAHLSLASNIYEFKNQSLLIYISLHLGSLLAILFYFKNEIFNFNNNLNLFYKIIIATIPLVIIGYFLYYTGIIYELINNKKVIVWTTFFGAILLYIADRRKIFNNLENSFNFKSALIIGLFQVMALVPGVSRAGITITAGRILGFNRTDSTKISFYLSIPALAAASAIGIKDLLNENIEFNFVALIGIFLSFIFSLITIKYFLKFIKKFSFKIFILYRIILSLILLYIIYF
tara:strand:+ start:454 stop:1224 length:771 start_codon:yes stop_codon:yes gene_type:complete